MDNLVEVLYRSIYRGIQKQWEISKKATAAQPHLAFKDFQLRLKSLKNMNQTILEDDYNRVLTETNAKSLEDFIHRCVILSTQAIATVNQPSDDPIKVKAPKGEKFLHRCYIMCAQDLYEKVWLMEDRKGEITSYERGKNLEKVYKIVRDCIKKSVKYFVPWDELAKSPLNVQGRTELPQQLMYGAQGWNRHPLVDLSSSSSGMPPFHQPKDYSQIDAWRNLGGFQQQQQQQQAETKGDDFKEGSEDFDTSPAQDLSSAEIVHDEREDDHDGDVQEAPELPQEDDLQKVIYVETTSNRRRLRSRSPCSESEDVSIAIETTSDGDRDCVPTESAYDNEKHNSVDLSVFPLVEEQLAERMEDMYVDNDTAPVQEEEPTRQDDDNQGDQDVDVITPRPSLLQTIHERLKDHPLPEDVRPPAPRPFDDNEDW